MYPEKYLFSAPIDIPTIRCTKEGGFFDVVSDDAAGNTYRLRWRAIEDWPVVVSTSTGQTARLVRNLTNDVQSLPRLGRVTLTFEQCLAAQEGEETKLYDSWDEEDWKLQD